MRLSTDTVPARNRLDYWREIVCDTFVELECRIAHEPDFSGSIETRTLGEIRFNRVSSAAQHVVRTQTRIARSGLDYFFLSLQLHGRGCHKQDGRIAHLGPGDFSIYDTTRPYELLFADPFSQLVLCLPRQSVKNRLVDAERLTACTVQGRTGSGRLASLFVRQLAAQLDSIDAASLPRMQASVVDLVATALAEQRRQADPVLSYARNVLIQRVLQFMEDNLGDPDLTCATIAQRHRISERYLRLRFEEIGTCASDWLRRRRLECARQDLVDPGKRHLSVTTIGFTWGFKEAAHFSRAFKTQFGCTPSDARTRER